jgi:triphosphatase
LKFRVGEDALVRLRGHPELQGREHLAHLRSVYFDTAACDLARSGLCLRVRNTGQGFIQTVKQRDGAGGFIRGEWEVKVPDESIDIDALAKTPAGNVLEGKLHVLKPIFSTTVDRLARSCGIQGSLIEVSFDSGEILADGRREPIHELELELKEGDVAALSALGRTLVADMSIGLSFESKSDWGYRVSGQTEFEPRLSIDPICPPDAAAGETFQRIARGCLAQAAANAELLRAVQRPEVVHQLRVGMRRLGTAVAAFRPILLDDAFVAVNRERKWLTAELDMARDLDVFIGGAFRLAAETTGDKDFTGLRRQLLKAQAASYKQAVAAVRSKRYAIMLFEIAAWIETGSWGHLESDGPPSLRDMPVKTFAAEALDRLYKRVRKRGRKFARLDPGERHKLRVRAKELRYAAQFFATVFDGRRKKRARFLAALERMQDHLGALNDIAVARDRILIEAALEQPQLAFAAGRVTGHREQEEAALLRKAAADLKNFHKATPFWRERG